MSEQYEKLSGSIFIQCQYYLCHQVNFSLVMKYHRSQSHLKKNEKIPSSAIFRGLLKVRAPIRFKFHQSPRSFPSTIGSILVKTELSVFIPKSTSWNSRTQMSSKFFVCFPYVQTLCDEHVFVYIPGLMWHR